MTLSWTPVISFKGMLVLFKCPATIVWIANFLNFFRKNRLKTSWNYHTANRESNMFNSHLHVLGFVSTKSLTDIWSELTIKVELPQMKVHSILVVLRLLLTFLLPALLATFSLQVSPRLPSPDDKFVWNLATKKPMTRPKSKITLYSDHHGFRTGILMLLFNGWGERSTFILDLLTIIDLLIIKDLSTKVFSEHF